MKNEIFTLLNKVCKYKYDIIMLPNDRIIRIRNKLYKLGYDEWVIDVLWDYVWDYKTYYQVYDIYKTNLKNIKRKNK